MEIRGDGVPFNRGFSTPPPFFLTQHLLVGWYLDSVAIFLVREYRGAREGGEIIPIIDNEL